jgi:hypothetical protein
VNRIEGTVSRVVVALFAGAVALWLAFGPRSAGRVDADQPYRIDVRVIGDENVSTSIWIDPVSSSVRIAGSSGRQYVVTEDRVLVAAEALPGDLQEPGVRWYAVQRDELPDLGVISPSSLQRLLVLDAKECTSVESSADVMLINLLVLQPSPDQRFQSCGPGIAGGSFADGASISGTYEAQTDPLLPQYEGEAVSTLTEDDPRFAIVLSALDDCCW